MSASPYENEAFFQQLLAKAVSAGASDIHIKVGQPPGARIKGDMVYFRVDRITPVDSQAVAKHLMAREEGVDLTKLKEKDTAYSVSGLARFRVNVYRQRGSLATVLRVIPADIPTLESLGVAVACRDLCDRSRG